MPNGAKGSEAIHFLLVGNVEDMQPGFNSLLLTHDIEQVLYM